MRDEPQDRYDNATLKRVEQIVVDNRSLRKSIDEANAEIDRLRAELADRLRAESLKAGLAHE